jgi:hypothetical protein
VPWVDWCEFDALALGSTVIRTAALNMLRGFVAQLATDAGLDIEFVHNALH